MLRVAGQLVVRLDLDGGNVPCHVQRTIKRAEMWALFLVSSSPSGLAVTYTDNYVGVPALSSGEATCICPTHSKLTFRNWNGRGKKICGAVS